MGNKAKRSAKQQRPDVLICFLLASRRSDRAKRLKQNNNKSYSAQLLTAAGRCKNNKMQRFLRHISFRRIYFLLFREVISLSFLPSCKPKMYSILTGTWCTSSPCLLTGFSSTRWRLRKPPSQNWTTLSSWSASTGSSKLSQSTHFRRKQISWR